MSTQTSVWVMILTDGVSDKIRDLVDSGYYAEARDLDFHLKSISEKLNALVGERGGSVKISIYDRQVLELPVSVAEDMPMILAGYRQVFGPLMSVGIGLDINEAAIAAKKSTFTNDIEMYDPADESFKQIRKTLQLEDDLFQPQPNLTDRTHPPSPLPDASQPPVGKFVPGLNAQQSLEAENALIQATVQQLMGPAAEMQQQAMQQQQQAQQQQQDGEPGSLMEALSGEKKKDKPDTSTKESKKDSGDSDDDSDDNDSDSEDSDDDSDSSKGDETTDKLGDLLASVQDKLPKLMEMHDKNPESFKKVVALIHKLVAVAKGRKKVEKSQVSSMTEELNKMLRIRYPDGTVKDRKKKVRIDGKARWRSVASGQVKDLKGQAISVASHNEKADDGTEGVRG